MVHRIEMSGHFDPDCEENFEISPGALGSAAPGLLQWCGLCPEPHRREESWGGVFETGQHVASPKNPPLCNLCQTMLGAMGMETESFGDSTELLKDVLVSERYCDRNGICRGALIVCV